MDYKQLLERVKQMREKIYNGTVVGSDSVNFCETLDYVVNFINTVEEVTKYNSERFSKENKELKMKNEYLEKLVVHYETLSETYKNIINKYKVGD